MNNTGPNVSEPFTWTWRAGATPVQFAVIGGGKVHVRTVGSSALGCYGLGNIPRSGLLSAHDFGRWPINSLCKRCMADELWSAAQCAARDAT